MYHVSVEQMRMIEWARSWNWAVWFPDLATTPEDFVEWFPASDIEYDLAKLNKKEFDTGISDFSIPLSTSECEISLTCYDGGKKATGKNPDLYQLHRWMTRWMAWIADVTMGVRTLTEACRRIKIVHYDSMSNMLESAQYLVFPTGDVKIKGGSEAENLQLDMSLVIAGRENETWRPSIGLQVLPSAGGLIPSH